MRVPVALLFLVSAASYYAASASAAPPTLTPTGELIPNGVCVRFMDIMRTGGGSVADGKAERIATMAYDAKRRRVGERWWGFDTPLRIVKHTYNKVGRRTRTTWRLANKRLVLTKRYRYNRRGKLLTTTTSYKRSGERWVDDVRYDRRGRVVRRRGSINPKTGKVYAPTHQFLYKHGRIVTELINRDNKGGPEERLSYQYNARGVLIAKLMKPASPKYAEQMTEFKYNKRGQLTERKVTHIWPKRGSWSGPRKVESFAYDAAGNLVTIERRVTPGGVVGVRTTFDYACLTGGRARVVPAEKCRPSNSRCGTP